MKRFLINALWNKQIYDQGLDLGLKLTWVVVFDTSPLHLADMILDCWGKMVSADMGMLMMKDRWCR